MEYAEPLRVVGAIVLGCGAIYLASNNVAGWGWFLFSAVILGTLTIKI